MNTPEYYTESKTGTWKKFTCEPIWHCLDFRLLQQRHPEYIILKGLKVHALAFDNPACGVGNFLYWDCILGFHQ